MRFVIVGGGVAGITAALDLARRNIGAIDVFTDEEYPYYYRPQLTEFLAGTITMSKLLRRPLSYYEERGIDFHLGRRVTALDADQRTITLADGEVVPYDRLLLALGSYPAFPPIEGITKPGVKTWRTLEDTLELEKAAISCHDIAVLGGGLLGLEAARGLRTFCSKVTVLEYFPRLLPRQLDDEGAGLLADFVRALGLNVIVGAQTEAILGDPKARAVLLKDGREINAETVLVAAGVRSNAALAQSAGLAVDRGVVVDERMATSDPNIYAAGDVAVYKGYCWAIAPIAQAQARIAAANMAGESAVYDAVVPSTTLKVVGIDVSSIGLVNPDENDHCMEIRRLDKDSGTYKKIVLQDGIIVGAIIINDKQLAKDLESRIATRAKLSPDEARALLD